ncbi:MAG: LacI family transcriptional regulator [Ruminococcus sp.]|nr:LacI family transcriptional regulator [Ruminococcus sp.]
MATLKDVAKEAGLTVSTVSRILNNRGYISDNARQKVEKAMKKLNYFPNEAARSLQGKSTNTIGIIVPHIHHPYFAGMISHLEAQARKKGYKVLLCNSQYTQEKEEESIKMCISSKVAGVIYCSEPKEPKPLEESDIPIVTIGHFSEQGRASVECDHKQGGSLAVEKLSSCGCERLLYIDCLDPPFLSACLCAEGVRETSEKKKLFCAEFSLGGGETHLHNRKYGDLIEKALRKYPKTDGIFAGSDVIAAQVLQVCRRRCISVPEQMKIIGFDDADIASLTTPELTTVHRPVKEMAEIAVNLLHDSAAGKLVAKRTVLPVYLVERETT